jgi:hypothetical protein
MVEDPGAFGNNGPDESQGISQYLNLFQNATSEHAKTVLINEKFIPWIQRKGIHPFIRGIQAN